MLKKLYHKLWSTIENKYQKTSFIESENIIAKTNLLYGKDIKNNRYDAYFPNNNNHEKLPTVFVFHGGGYISGNKEGTSDFCRILARKGCLVFNIEYTKCDNEEKKYFPYQVYEFFQFYKSITEHTDFVDLIDFNNIFISGNSAGAHIAALIANIQTNQMLKMDFNLQGGPPIKGVILLSPSFGAYKFAGLFPKNNFHDIIFGTKNIRNPISNITHNLDITTEAFPPSAMFSVKGDFVVGAHKERFLNLAKELKLSVRHYDICSGYKLFHSSMVDNPEKYPIFIDKVMEFINDAHNNKFVKGVKKEQILEEENIDLIEKASIS